MKIHVEEGRCQGHARCAATAPSLYDLGEDGLSIADGKEVPPGMEQDARDGAAACPERALSVSP